MTKVASNPKVASQLATPPERIYNWLNTQMSVARHYGGMRYNGHDYDIAYTEEGQPLVRRDVGLREVKEKAAAKKAAKAEEKQRAAEAQKGLI